MKMTTKRLCRAGVIAALYAALTYVFAPFAFGPLQVRPSEALCLLPLFFSEAVPALFVGCALSNITSPYALYDVPFGALTTLLAALVTYMVGRFFKKQVLKIIFGGIAPVLLNALVIPLIILFLGGGEGSSLTTAYFLSVGTIALTEIFWIYGLGVPLYFALLRMKKRGENSLLSR